MDREIARRGALLLMKASELNGWVFRSDFARGRVGSYTHQTKTITLSAPLTDLYDPDTVGGVILCEIARALVGPQHHHDEEWKRTVRMLGAPDTARLPSSLPTPPESWVGTCPHCGAQRRLFRAPGRVSACGSYSPNFDPARILTWEYEGVTTVPGGAYTRELHQIRRGLRS